MESSMKGRYKLMANPSSCGRTTCSAYGCNMRCGTNALSEIKMFYFPKDQLRRKRWELATRRANWKANNKSRLCCKHFITGKPSKDPKHPDYVPSIFVFSKNLQNGKRSSNQGARIKTNEKYNNSEAESFKNVTCHSNTSSQEGTCCTPSCGIYNFCGNCFTTESVSPVLSMNVTPLNETLTQLLVKLKDMEEEREQLRNELASCREEIHQLQEAHKHCLIQSPIKHSTSDRCSITSKTSNQALEMLESIHLDKPPGVNDHDSMASLFLEQNDLQPEKSSMNKGQKKHFKETSSDEVIGIIEQFSSSKKKKMKSSNINSKRTSESLNREKSSNSGSPITIVYLNR